MARSEAAKAFMRLKDETGATDTAAALLVLAEEMSGGLERLRKTLFDFDHQICLGIRHGLMGNLVDATASVGDLSGISDAIEELTSAVDHVSQVVEAHE